MDNSELYFIELLSSHINRRKPKDINSNLIDWKKIGRLSVLHDVSAIISTQIKLLPKESQPNGDIKSKFNQILGKTLQDYEEKEKAYSFLFELLNKNQIKHMPLKGAVIRNYYPVPELRTSGDIDVIIEKDKFEECGDMLLHNGFEQKQRTGIEDDLIYNNQFFELKKYFETVNEKTKIFFSNPFSNELSNKDNFTYYLYPKYHLAYVIYHFLCHLKIRGAGLRQIMDICVLYNQFDIDIDEFIELMDSFNLKKSTNAILYICKKYFELDIDLDFELDEKLENNLLDIIINGGAFGIGNGGADLIHLTNTINESSSKSDKINSLKAFFRLFKFSVKSIKMYYPYTRKYPILVPIGYINRIFDAIFKRGKTNIKKINKIFGDQSIAKELNKISIELEINNLKH